MQVRSAQLSVADSVTLGWCNLWLGNIAWSRGDFALARTRYLEAFVSGYRAGEGDLEAFACQNLGILRKQFGRWQEAKEEFQHALEIWRATGNHSLASNVERGLAILEWKRGRLEAGRGAARASLHAAAGTRTAESEVHALQLLGVIDIHAGEFTSAEHSLTQASALWPGDSTSRPSLLTTEFLGDVHLEQGQAEQALRFYDEVFPKAMALVPKGDIVAELRRRRAECYLLLGRAADAYDEAMTGLAHCRELGDRYEEAATYRAAALSAAALGRPDEAKGLFHQGFTLYDDIETPYEWGKLWMSYGDWLASPTAGPYLDQRGALEACHAARDHFERMGAKAKLAEANARIAHLTAEISPGVSAPVVAEAAAVVGDQARSPHRPPRRRPSGASELERRSRWALENFGTVTANAGMFHQLEMVEQLARSKAPVLVLGESGTGKELIALALHRLSGRPGQFMAINCAALPRDVIQSELFGHVAGSFTGASRDKAGLFEVCDRGTALLDEVGEMPPDLQSHLLRFLETGESRRVGATRNVVVDTRVVASTNRDRALLKRGDRFRIDLYYRLAHGVIELPPLRRRGARDIELLAHHFLAQACREEHKRVTLSEDALDRLVHHPWPGNIRELKAELLRRVVLARDGHEVAGDEFHFESGITPATLEEELEHTERERIRQVVAQFSNKADAARALGVPRTTLINKMKRLGLEE